MNEPLASFSLDRETMEHKIRAGKRIGYELVTCGYAKEHDLWYAVMKKEEEAPC